MLGYGAAKAFLITTDAEERSRIQMLARAARAIQNEVDLARATHIANAVARSFNA
jgi:hypothetical protein